MAVSNQKKWIILLNKSPRGPFVEAEVKDLLRQGIVRHNDLAFLMPETKEEGGAHWKFIWQFPEYDSRIGEKEKPPPAAVLEKRTPKTESQIQAQVDENIPLDLKSITIDDLILKVNSAPKREISVSRMSDDKEKYQPTRPGGSSLSFNSRATSAGLAILALVGILYAGFKEFLPSTGAEKRDVAQERKLPGVTGPQGLPKSRAESTKPSGPNPSPAQPAERDRGQVREDEILRMREEERRREAAERERERELREREENSVDDEEAESEEGSKKKAKKARKAASEDSEESESEDKPGSKRPDSGAPAEEEAPPASWLE